MLIMGDEAAHCREQIKIIDAELHEVRKALRHYDGAILYGQSKDLMKGQLEIRLATLEQHRRGFLDRLGR
ncbi:MAG: hypothetical protein QM773_13785 [Hyphomonadaceae bacterium]